MLKGTKSAFRSLGVLGGSVATALGAVTIYGYTITASDVAEIGELVKGIGVLISGLVAVYGRIRATKQIG